MNSRTWLIKDSVENPVTPENVIELLKLNGFIFKRPIDGYNYFDKDNVSGFVTTRDDGNDVITMYYKGVKYSVMYPISMIEKLFISGRRNSTALNVYVVILGHEQVLATK